MSSSFRAPTLYQRFSEYGLATLSPESGRHAELALRWSDGRSQASATAWHNRLRDLIGRNFSRGYGFSQHRFARQRFGGFF